jgi:hypothetical protein
VLSSCTFHGQIPALVVENLRKTLRGWIAEPTVFNTHSKWEMPDKGERRMKLKILIAAISWVVWAATAHSATVNAATPTSGDCTFGCTPTFQQIYDNSLFGGSAININSVSTYQFGSTGVGGSWDMYLSTSPSVVGSISSTFATNRGADFSYFGSIGPTNVGDMGLITFSGSFSYDPTAGDLLVEWVWVSGATSGNNYAQFGTSDLSRVYSFSAGATTGSANQSYGIATQFDVGPLAPVPLPAAFPLLLAALGGLGFAARRRKTA